MCGPSHGAQTERAGRATRKLPTVRPGMGPGRLRGASAGTAPVAAFEGLAPAPAEPSPGGQSQGANRALENRYGQRRRAAGPTEATS